jgi:hypothetical protein
MKYLACLLALLFAAATPAQAESALVVGGEHGDFTRLVVEAGDVDGWRFGRATDGYELQLPTATTAYDVTKAFDRIAKTRIASLWQDPETGRLRFSLACACNAIAFEFRPGTVVIDIRDGAPAEGSSFETPLDPVTAGQPAEAVAEELSVTEGAKPAYDWVAMLREPGAEAAESVLPLPLDLPTGEVSLDPLRDALLAEISKGAAQGVVDIAEALPKSDPDKPVSEDNPWTRISVGEMPGLVTGDRKDAPAMTAQGLICLSDSQLDIGSWGLPGPVVTQIGLARTGIVGEFDTPSEEAILRAARFHVFLGFGAEARQYLGFLGAETDKAVPLLKAMARIVDEEPVEPDPFAGMEACDTAAALWANLAAGPSAPILPGTNAAAVARSLSGFPPHLRKHLGPMLVDKFLASGDQETARLLRDAVLRLPDVGDPETDLMDAKYQLAEGNDQGAAELAETVMSERGAETAEAAVTLVEASFRSDRRIDPEIPSALAAFLKDAHGTENEAGLLRATALAHAMTGDFATALAMPINDSETFSDLWSMAAEAAPDDVFLERAAALSRDHPEIRPDVGTSIAGRLMGFGFADLALGWLGAVTEQDSAQRRLMAANAHLAVRDARAALTVLQGMTEAEATTLRARAELQLGDMKTAAETLSAGGDAAGGQRTAVWTQDWTYIKETGPDAWQEAVELLEPPAAENAPPDGSIAEGTALADESAAARAALEALLATAAEPAPSQ